MSIEVLQEGIQRAIQHPGVRVEKAEVPPGCALDPLIVGRSKADIVLVLDEDYLGRQVFETRHIPRRRGIIDDKDLKLPRVSVWRSELLPLKRGNRLHNKAADVIIDNNNREIDPTVRTHCRLSATYMHWATMASSVGVRQSMARDRHARRIGRLAGIIIFS
jgi:hypothetical protein